jgi:hypothetical protein
MTTAAMSARRSDVGYAETHVPIISFRAVLYSRDILRTPAVDSDQDQAQGQHRDSYHLLFSIHGLISKDLVSAAASLPLGPAECGVFFEGDAACPITASQPPGRACKTSKHYRSRLARPLFFKACTHKSRSSSNR